MTQEIINQYQIKLQNLMEQYGIKFLNKIFDWDGNKEIVKSLKVNNKYLNEFLDNWNADEIEELLLPDINQALLNPNAEIENGSETINILIYQNKVDFYTLDEGFVYTVPTSDFKQIVEGWRDFLQTPPLNGPYVVN